MIAAAGSGERLGAGGPKAFVALAGRPLIEWSLRALAGSRRLDAALIAVPAGSEDAARRSLDAAAPGLPAEVLPGGASRAESVSLAVMRSADGLVAIHDAARPLVDSALFDRLLERLEADSGAAGAIAAAPIGDTLKRSRPEASGADVVAETVSRERLWAAQTPQAFRREPLVHAQESARAAGRLAAATDEAGLIEAAGGRVLIEPAAAPNIKVTTAGDLALAEALLGGQGRV